MGPSATANAASSYVTLGIGDEIFAVDVAVVREILAYRTVVRPGGRPGVDPFLDVRSGEACCQLRLTDRAGTGWHGRDRHWRRRALRIRTMEWTSGGAWAAGSRRRTAPAHAKGPTGPAIVNGKGRCQTRNA